MFSLTKQERLILYSLALIIFCGSTIHYALKKFPAVRNILNLIESETLYKKIDINTASAEQFESLPLIGKVTAQRIVDYRRHVGRFQTTEELKDVQGIGETSFQRMLPYLKKMKSQ